MGDIGQLERGGTDILGVINLIQIFTLFFCCGPRIVTFICEAPKEEPSKGSAIYYTFKWKQRLKKTERQRPGFGDYMHPRFNHISLPARLRLGKTAERAADCSIKRELMKYEAAHQLFKPRETVNK